MAIEFNVNYPTSDPGGMGNLVPADWDDDEAPTTLLESTDDGGGYGEYLIRVDNDDIPAYFEERSGRLFSLYTVVPYPLPVDGRAQVVRNLVVITRSPLSVLTIFL